jgi:single-stranded DNA-binding protein
VNDSLLLLKFRLAFTRYDFQTKTTGTEFLPVTAFSNPAERIFSAISGGANYICCHCDIKVSSFPSKSGAQVQVQEHVIIDFRMFHKPKADAQLSAPQQLAQIFPQESLPPAPGSPLGSSAGSTGNQENAQTSALPGSFQGNANSTTFSNGSNSAQCYPADYCPPASATASLDLPY